MTDTDSLNAYRDELKGHLTEGEFREWKRLCKAFLDEPLDPDGSFSDERLALHTAFCQSSREVLLNSNFPNLQNWAQLGLQIADRSVPAAIAYFQSTAVFVRHQSAFNVRTWAAGSLQLLNIGEGSAEKAAAAFFMTTAELLGYMTFRELRAWTTAGLTLARNYPHLAYEFFSIVPEGLDFLYNTEWLKICKLGYSLARTHPKEIIELYHRTPLRLLFLSPSVRLKVLDAAGRRTIRSPETVNIVFNDLVEILCPLSHPTQETVINHEEIIAGISVEAAIRYTAHMDHLLEKMSETFLGQWTMKGISLLKEETQLGIDYFSFDSQKAHHELTKWENAIHLDDYRQRLSLFAQAVAGKRLVIKSAEESMTAIHPAARLYPSGDGERIYLPPISAGEETPADNFRYYKLATAHQAGYVASGTFDEGLSGILSHFNTLSHKQLAEDIFLILEDHRIDRLLGQEYPGLKKDMDWFLSKEIQKRKELHTLSVQEALVESILRLTTTGLKKSDIPVNLTAHVSALSDILDAYVGKIRNLWDTLTVWQYLYNYISNLSPPEPYSSPPPMSYRGQPDFSRYHGTEPEQKPDAENKDGVTAEEETPSGQNETGGGIPGALHRSAYVTFVETERVVDAPARYITDLDDVRSPGGSHHGDAESQKSPSSAPISVPVRLMGTEGPFYYDEWDYLAGSYRKKWCRLYEKDIQSKDATWANQILARHYKLVQKVRQQFQRIRPELMENVRRVEWGDDIDFSAMVQGIVDRKAGISPSEKIFTRRERKLRHVSLLFLLDMSASTNESVSVDQGFFRREKKIIDIEVESLVVLMEALETLSDAYGIFGFSGSGKSQVDFYRIKEFSDAYSEELKKRIGGIQPKQGTRMGPAIRHAIGKLRSVESDKRILLLLSDGYPQDYDYGEDRRSISYGLHDTMMALLEAKKEGIRPFCITVDQSGNDYLRKIADQRNYLVIKDIFTLPEILPKVVESLIN